MNPAVNTLYAEYLEHTGGDKAAAASLALAAVFAKGQPAPVTGRPMTLPEVARHLRIRPNKVLAWVRSGELKGYDVTARPGSRRPKYRVDPDALAAFIQRRAILPPMPQGRPAGPRRRIPQLSRPVLGTASHECGP